MISDQNKSEKNEGISIKELPETFIGRGEVKGFHFRQLLRSEFAYIYHVSQPNGPQYYEVIKRIEDYRFNRISYPGSQSFGICAWTSYNYLEALNRFRLLN